MTLAHISQLSETTLSTLDYASLTEPVTVTRLISELEQTYPGYAHDLLAIPRNNGTIRQIKQVAVPVVVLKFALYWNNALIARGLLEYARSEYRRMFSN